MKHVYLLESESDPARRYVGITSNFESRLNQHNGGKSPHTRKYTPWRPIVVVSFADDERATAFETYLKSGSGHAFAKRHFW